MLWYCGPHYLPKHLLARAMRRPESTNSGQGLPTGERRFEQLKLTKDDFLELYSVDGPLGQGAFGAVMRGTDKRSGDGIAIKMIDKEQAAGAADEEIRVWRLVRHPACVCLLGVYDLSQYMALCCELCEGGEPGPRA